MPEHKYGNGHLWQWAYNFLIDWWLATCPNTTNNTTPILLYHQLYTNVAPMAVIMYRRCYLTMINCVIGLFIYTEVMVNRNWQLDEIENHLQDVPLSLSMGDALIMLIKVRRQTHCRWHLHPRWGVLEYTKWISIHSLLPACGCHMSICFKLLPFGLPTTINCTTELQAKRNPSFLTLLLLAISSKQREKWLRQLSFLTSFLRVLIFQNTVCYKTIPCCSSSCWIFC